MGAQNGSGVAISGSFSWSFTTSTVAQCRGGDQRALTALAAGGVYAYGSGNAFPSSTYLASNYWVDVVYSPS